MVASGERMLSGNPELPGHFGESGAFVVGSMAEPGVDIVPDYREKWNFGAVFLKKCLDGISITVILRYQTEGRIRVFINSRGKTFVHQLTRSGTSGRTREKSSA